MNLKYIFLLMVIFIIGCSDNEKPIVDDSIKLSCYSVHLLAGDEGLVDLLSNSDNLSLIEENPEIASGWWTNRELSIQVY